MSELAARRSQTPFLRSGEFLLVEWQWKENHILAEQVSVPIASPAAAFTHLNGDTFRIHIFRPGDASMDRCEDVTETLACEWLALNTPDPQDPGQLPLFVRQSIAWSDRCDRWVDYSINRS